MSKSSTGGMTDLLSRRVSLIASAPAVAADIGVNPPRQRAARRPVYRQAVLVLEQGERLPVVIRNVSDGGIRVEFFRNTPISEMVMVDEASLALRAWSRVVWQRDGASGLYFVSRQSMQPNARSFSAARLMDAK